MAVLMFKPTLPLWMHLPELRFVQFPLALAAVPERAGGNWVCSGDASLVVESTGFYRRSLRGPGWLACGAGSLVGLRR